MIIDGEKCVMGRIASLAAKTALKGETVEIYNAPKIIITGNKKSIMERQKLKQSFRDQAKPSKSPHYPRKPDLFVKRAIRTMLPWRTQRGREAFRKIKVYMDAPKKEAIKKFEMKKDITYMTIGQICKSLGWKG